MRTDVVQFKTDDAVAVTALGGFAAANGGSVVPAADTAAVSAAFQDSAKALDAQVKFTVSSTSSLTGKHALAIKGRAGSTPFGFRRDVDFGDGGTVVPTPEVTAVTADSGAPRVDARVQAAATLPLGATGQPWMLWLAALLVAVALFGLVVTSMEPSLQTRRERRVESIQQYVLAPRQVSRSDQKAQPTAIGAQIVGFGDSVMKGRKSTQGTMALIERADLPFRAGEWFVVEAVAGILGALLGIVVFRNSAVIGVLIGAVVLGTLGLVIPTVVLRFLANRRARAFERVLPDVLMLVATSLRSGFGLQQALDAVARDAAEPAAKEFSRALAETRIGTEVPEALDHVADRMDSTPLRWAVMAIRIQRQVGGNLADTLKTTAATLREREALHRQVQTLSAEGRLSAYILIALPIGMFFYMTVVNYDYISRLWTQPLGIVMSLVGILLLVVGVFWMRRVVKIEV